MKWLTDKFKSKKPSEKKIDYFRITSDWNADPVSPEIHLEIDKNNLITEIFVNHLVFDDFEEGDKAKITFKNCSIYSLNACNDEGYYYGQYRINSNELPWGEFYEIMSGIDRKFPEPITRINDELEGKRHYIFLFKDETFECLADHFKLELQNKKGTQKKTELQLQIKARLQFKRISN